MTGKENQRREEMLARYEAALIETYEIKFQVERDNKNVPWDENTISKMAMIKTKIFIIKKKIRDL